MFRKTIFKKITASTVFLAIILQGGALLMLPKQAQAQASSGGAATLGPILGAGVGCALTNILGGATKFSDIIGSQSSELVPVGDSKVKTEVQAQKEKESCLDAIAYAAAKVALRKITMAQLQWINSGFKGEPLFVKNPVSFFKSIRDDEVNSITGVLTGNAALYPFGKDLARSIILSTQATFAANAQYSLDKVLSHANAVQFQADFSAGGWDGWLAATQILANNQIGAHIQTADEVAFRLQGTAQSNAQDVRDKLMQAHGFLGLEKCVELTDGSLPNNQAFDYEHDDENYSSGPTGPVVQNGPSMQNGEFSTSGNAKGTRCKRWETITPGEAVANQMNITLGTTQRQLELADELNESIGAVFDALVSQLLNKGLSSLSDSSSADVGIYGGYGSNSTSTSLSSSNTDVTDPQQWFNQNPTFNIWKDLQPLIDTQWKYKNLLDDHYTDPATGVTYPLPHTDASGYVFYGENNLLNNQLIPAIYELDFCVPGPNPLWKTKADENVQKFIEGIPSDPDKLDQFWLVFNKLDQVFGSGYLSGIIAGLGAYPSDSERLNEIIHELFIKLWNLDAIKSDQGLDTKGKGEALARLVYEGYQQQIEEKYSYFNLPSVAYPAYKEYKKMPAYLAGVDDNATKIEERASLIRRLELIRDQVAKIPEPSSHNFEDSPDHEIIAAYLRTIGRIAPNLVTENTLQDTEDEILTLIDTIDYVKGPSGLINDCKTEIQSPIWSSIKGLRFPYPTALLPQSVQDQYNGALGGVLPETVNLNHGTTRTFLPGVNYGKMSWQTGPDSDYVLISHLVNVADNYNLSGFEKWIEIY